MLKVLAKSKEVSVLVSHEVTCPLCESYNVYEDSPFESRCFTCGTSWKTTRTIK